MGYSDLSSSSIGDGVWCKKHPRHKQSPGVCSCCLSEKLSFHLNSSSSFSSIRSSSVISSSPSYSPSPDQSSSSPPYPIHHPDNQNQTILTTINKGGVDDDQVSSTIASGNLDEYRRSHSSGIGHEGNSTGGKKKGGAGFLLKFLKPTTKKCSRMVCMMQHSKTMNEARTKRFY